MSKFSRKIAQFTLLTFVLFSITVFLSVASVAEDSGLVAYWTFDDTLKDSTSNANNGAAIGNISYINAVFGKGARFGGNTYIEVPDSDSLDVSNAFTFSVWVYKEPTDEGVPFIAKYGDDGDSNWAYGMYEWWWLKTTAWYGSADGGDDVSADKPVDIQKWTLITTTYDGKNLRIYYNDQLVKSELVNGIVLTKSNSPLYIGFANFMNKDQYFKGVMDDLRIYNRALDYDSVAGLYTAGTKGLGKDLVLPPNKLVAYYKFNGNGEDKSGMGNDAEAVNFNGGISYITGLAGKAARFNGSSYFEVKDSDSLDIDKAFTIGAWMYREADSTMPCFAKYGQSQDVDGTDLAYSLYDWNGSSGQTLTLANFYQIDTAYSNDFSSYMESREKTWYYYSATYDGNNVKTYINGVLKQTQPFKDFIISHSSGPLWIGASTSTEFFKGAMDELKIYNYALNANEVKALYNYKDSISISPVIGRIIPSTIKTKQVFNFKVNLKSIDTGKFTDVTKTGTTYKTSNSKVLKVEKGKITAVGKGKASITATHGPHTASVTFIVK